MTSLTYREEVVAKPCCMCGMIESLSLDVERTFSGRSLSFDCEAKATGVAAVQ